MDITKHRVLWPILSVLLQIQGALSQISMPIAPKNQAVLVGANVTFQCAVDQAEVLTDFISWEECITPQDATCLRISNDENIQYAASGGDALRETRYSVQKIGTKQFDLGIRHVNSAEDAGKYRCLSRNDANIKMDAQLVILESNTNCSSNISASNGTLPVPFSIYVSCEIRFNGTFAPAIEFIRETLGHNVSVSDGVSIITQPGFVQYTLPYVVETKDIGSIFYARTFFETPTVGANEATNAPSYEHILKFDPLTALSNAGNLQGNLLFSLAMVGLVVLDVFGTK